MDDELLGYYEKELTFIRQMGAEFARKYPKIAGRLLLEPDKCEDPHTERLIEAFAFLAARVHKKIDDEVPEITESLLSIIYPHYINPIPAMTIVRFEPIKQNIPASGYFIEKGTTLYSKPVAGIACQFSTSYPVTAWPVEVTSASLKNPRLSIKNAQQAIQIQLKTFNSLSVSQLGWDSLRFFLNAQHQHVFNLYELLMNNICHLELEAKTKQGQTVNIQLSPNDIKPVGFAREENLLPYSSRSFPGYLLLFEYFCFPEKFLFVDITGLGRLKDYELTDTLDIWIYLDRPAKQNLVMTVETFCLNVSPAVNLYKRIAEPVRIEHRLSDYRIIPDIRRQNATEVFTVDSVVSSLSGGKVIDYRPIFSLRHLGDEEEGRKVFWNIKRLASGKKGDSGTEVYLSFTDASLKPTDPGVETVTLHVTCTNRDLPARLSFGDQQGDFDLDTAGPFSKIISLIKPTSCRRPSLGGSLQWKLISHLSLNYLSLVGGGEEALKEILKLYDFDNSPSTGQQISGITKLSTDHVTKRIGVSFIRGIQTAITFDEDKFVGSGLFLFASILETFLAQYVSINSFVQLEARTVQKKEPLKKWPPRNGSRILL